MSIESPVTLAALLIGYVVGLALGLFAGATWMAARKRRTVR